MSIKTWKEEFYPVAPKKRMSTLEAIEHSLRKWEGLRKSNLKKHDVFKIFFGDNIVESDSSECFLVNSSTCALCQKFYKSEISRDEDGNFVSLSNCAKCPLAKVLENPCDHGEEKSPYGEFVNNGNPAPMISALKKALRMEKKNDQ